MDGRKNAISKSIAMDINDKLKDFKRDHCTTTGNSKCFAIDLLIYRNLSDEWIQISGSKNMIINDYVNLFMFHSKKHKKKKKTIFHAIRNRNNWKTKQKSIQGRLESQNEN